MILVAAALREELEPHFDQEDVVYSGIGKINACFALTRALKDSRIELVVNFGSAASSEFLKGEIVQCGRIFERDMQCQLPEFKDHNPEHLDTHPFYLPSLKIANCYTGDSFLSRVKVRQFSGVVDMEAFAFAKACHYMSIPFLCFKAITDGVNPNSEKEWRRAVNAAAKQFKEIYDLIKDTRK